MSANAVVEIEMIPATPENMLAAGIEISHHSVAEEVYIKRALIPSGVVLVQHDHPYDHASALVSGTVRLDVDGVSREVTGPAMLMIEAGKAHAITALTPSVWHCIHITDDTDPASVDNTILGRS